MLATIISLPDTILDPPPRYHVSDLSPILFWIFGSTQGISGRVNGDVSRSRSVGVVLLRHLSRDMGDMGKRDGSIGMAS